MQNNNFTDIQAKNRDVLTDLNSRRIVQETVKQVIDHSTGEVQTTEISTSFSIGKEPNFIKIYLDDIMYFIDMPSSASGILLSIAKRMSYDNKVTLVKSIKEDIAKETNLDLGTINNAISNFKKKNILLSAGRSVYTINPHLIAKGKWQDISKLRLQIEYTPKGRSIKSVEGVLPPGGEE